MNRFVKTSVATLFATSLLAGGAFAQANNSPDTKNKTPTMEEQQDMSIDSNSTGSIRPNMMSEQDVGGWQSGNVTVVQISTLNDEDPNRVFLQDRMNASPDEVAALQSSIEANPALKAQLESQNVQLSNVVAAEKAADGSVTFYVQ